MQTPLKKMRLEIFFKIGYVCKFPGGSRTFFSSKSNTTVHVISHLSFLIDQEKKEQSTLRASNIIKKMLFFGWDHRDST